MPAIKKGGAAGMKGGGGKGGFGGKGGMQAKAGMGAKGMKPGQKPGAKAGGYGAAKPGAMGHGFAAKSTPGHGAKRPAPSQVKNDLLTELVKPSLLPSQNPLIRAAQLNQAGVGHLFFQIVFFASTQFMSKSFFSIN